MPTLIWFPFTQMSYSAQSGCQIDWKKAIDTVDVERIKKYVKIPGAVQHVFEELYETRSTPLRYAIEFGYFTIADFLLYHGANINAYMFPDDPFRKSELSLLYISHNVQNPKKLATCIRYMLQNRVRVGYQEVQDAFDHRAKFNEPDSPGKLFNRLWDVGKENFTLQECSDMLFALFFMSQVQIYV